MNTTSPSLGRADAPASGPRSPSAPAGGPPALPPRIAGGTATPPPPGSDKRLAAFASLLAAIDREDDPGMIASRDRLRRLGFDVAVARAAGGPIPDLRPKSSPADFDNVRQAQAERLGISWTGINGGGI